MDIFKNDATAFVELRGLGIASFCRKDGFFEEAFLRDPRHSFKIKIEVPQTVGGSTYDLIFDEPINELHDVHISIKTQGATETVGLGRWQPKAFNRLLVGNDPNDVRWVLDLGDELHGNDLEKNMVTRPPEKRPLSYVHIENALFYALRTPGTDAGTKPFFFRVVDGFPLPFGSLAESYGARIKANEGITISITIGNTDLRVPPLPHIEGKPYRITIENVDRNPGAPATDLDEMMKFVADPEGKSVSLVNYAAIQHEVPEKFLKLFASGPNYCHPGECTELCTHDLIP